MGSNQFTAKYQRIQSKCNKPELGENERKF